MLEELIVTNLGIIEEAHLEPGPGLVVVTGETGTGKTMLLGALRLLLGATARRDLVGPSGDEATVQARFTLGEDEVSVARRISKEGRSKAYLDGLMAPLRALEERTVGAVELVAQHDHLRLTNTAEVRRLIDANLDEDGAQVLDRYHAAWERLVDVRRRQEALGGDRRALERDLEVARHQAEEITAAGFVAGEDGELAGSADRLRNAQSIIEGLDEAATNLGEDGVEHTMDRVVLALTRVGDLDPASSGLLDQAVDLATLLAELRSDITAAAADIAAEPQQLEAVEARLALLGDLRRKYGETLDDVLSFAQTAEQRAAQLTKLLDEADGLDAALVTAEAAVAEAGVTLGAARRATAGRLAEVAVGHLAELGFSDPVVLFDVADTAPGPEGAQRIELRFASDAQLEAGPVGRIASGGELSRLVLALRLAAGAEEAAVAAFDEIDAGIGGSIALALGRKLARLAEHRQVLCVTHLPQVAAFAATHYVVDRIDGAAVVRKAEGEDRIEELARMLAGMPDSMRGREHAAELLAVAETAASD